VVNDVNIFIDVDERINFITNLKEKKVFMGLSGFLGQTTVPIIHDKPEVSTIYIFCGNKTRHEKWAQK
jgi:hypothetical protein